MARLEHYHTKFEERYFYHIYNRTVDKKPMFRVSGNYEYFLKRFNYYLSPVADTYAFCLLGNHFHFLLRIHDLLELTTLEKSSILKSDMPPNKTTHDIVSHQFRKFFQSYAMAYNKQYRRVGTLFQTPFKRALIHNKMYLLNLIFYIHANPQHHNIIHDFRDWEWSSYNRILNDKPSKLKKKEIIDLFGSKDGYIKYHEQQFRIMENKIISLEDG